MPSMLDIPALYDHVETPDLPTEQTPVRRAHAGFWRTLTQHVTWSHAHRPHSPQYPHTVPHHQNETPAERLIRQDPLLYLRAFSGV
jgi:hypothetical protein